MFKKIKIILILFCLAVLFSANSADAAISDWLGWVKQKATEIKSGTPPADWGGLDYQKIKEGDAKEIKKAESYAEQIQKFIPSGSDKMNDDLWVEITARLRCADVPVVGKKQTNEIISPFGVTAAEYAAYAWQMMADGKNKNFEELNQRYEDRYHELIAGGNCADVKSASRPRVGTNGTATTTASSKGMDDGKWIGITALFMCSPDLVNKIDAEDDWIFKKYGVSADEFISYGRKVKARADYKEIKEKARTRYWALMGSRVCDKLNQTVISSSGLAYTPFLMDDQNLWGVIKIKLKSFACKFGWKSKGTDCPVYSAPISSAGDSPTTSADDSLEQKTAKSGLLNLWEAIKCKIKGLFGKKCY